MRRLPERKRILRRRLHCRKRKTRCVGRLRVCQLPVRRSQYVSDGHPLPHAITGMHAVPSWSNPGVLQRIRHLHAINDNDRPRIPRWLFRQTSSMHANEASAIVVFPAPFRPMITVPPASKDTTTRATQRPCSNTRLQVPGWSRVVETCEDGVNDSASHARALHGFTGKNHVLSGVTQSHSMVRGGKREGGKAFVRANRPRKAGSRHRRYSTSPHRVCRHH